MKKPYKVPHNHSAESIVSLPLRHLLFFILTLSIVLSLFTLTSCKNDGDITDSTSTDTQTETEKETETDTDTETDGASVSYSDYNLSDYIKLCSYIGVPGKLDVDEITDDDVTAYINSTFLSDLSYEIDLEAGDVILPGDKVNINYYGYINGDFDGFTDGEQFEGGTYNLKKGYNLKLGSGEFVEGFEDGIVGHSVGETFDIYCTFPLDYEPNEKLRGVSVVYTITVNSAERIVYPELTDEICAQYSDYKTADECRAAVRVMLEEEALYRATQSLGADIFNYVYENSTVISYPEALIKAEERRVISLYEVYAENGDMTLDEFIEYYHEMSPDEFFKLLREQSKNIVRQNMILYLICDLEDIKITDAEYKAGAERIAKENEMGSADDAISYYGEEAIRKHLLFEKVYAFLAENASQPAE